MATERTEVKDEQGQEQEVKADAKEQDVQQETEQQEPDTVQMSKEDYEKELQREADRRVNDALKKREQEHKKEMEKRVQEERKEAEELAKLSEDERSKAEKEKEQTKLERERDQLEQERQEFEGEKLKIQAEKELSARSLPAEFAPYIYGETAEDTMERISTFEELWQRVIKEGVDARLKSPAPKMGGGKQHKYTREQLDNMTPDQINADWDNVQQQLREGKL